MSIVREKPQLDFVLNAHPGVIGQKIEQKDKSNAVFKISSCLKELETANFETLNPEIKFSIQPGAYHIQSNASTQFAGTCKVEETGSELLQIAGKNSLNFNQLTENRSAVTGRSGELRACPDSLKS
jgi:uncharacterized phage infection (PIP) family protein YhgE